MKTMIFPCYFRSVKVIKYIQYEKSNPINGAISGLADYGTKE